ncbi:MAG: MerR family transcriptional regulator [Candidatus Methylopumilus sp.]|jgi:DNA-binding transcriptional MerR regulator
MNNNFEISSAAKLSGLTISMVDYLCRTKVVMPSVKGQRGRGKKRQYTFGDVVILRAVARLLLAGVSVSRLKKALMNLRRHHPEITPDNLPKPYILCDGENVYLRHGDEVLESLTTGQFSFAFVIEIAKLRTEVLEQIEYNSAVA